MKYHLRCLQCNKTYADHTYLNHCTNGCHSLLRTEYHHKHLTTTNHQGPWRYHHWLPIKTINIHLQRHTNTPHTYRSTQLANFLGLKNLLITLNTHPHTTTGSITDIQAQITLQRILDSTHHNKPLVLASTGDTAISYTYYANLIHHPLYLFTTEDARQHHIWSYTRTTPYCHLFTVNGDYTDAAILADHFSHINGTLNEGGDANISRRDAIATIYYDAVRHLGTQPDHYFQSLGSGIGAIAVYEAALRLQQDGRYGKRPPTIHGSQNTPFAPMVDAWEDRSRSIDPVYQEEDAKSIVKQTYAHLLANRFPLYSHKGGVYDVFNAVHGEFYRVTKKEAKEAQSLFKKLEGVSILPEAGVTVASLLQAIHQETIEKDDAILINITGGGREEMHKAIYSIRPAILDLKKR